VFDLSYLYLLHKNSLGHLYSFAGKLRIVNMSKGNFAFPPASFLPQAMKDFEIEFLNPLKENSLDEIGLLKKLAHLHAELLFIHPFREGNGRTIRMFTNMIYLSKTGRELDFKILEYSLETYILAVQQAGSKQYDLMEELFLKMSSGL
jgi:cell filamentation protein